MAASKAIIQKRDTWWVGWIEEIPGVDSQDATREELLENLRSALVGEALVPWIRSSDRTGCRSRDGYRGRE